MKQGDGLEQEGLSVMGALQKPVTELTPQDRAALLKPLGTRGRPFPMRARIARTTQDGQTQDVWVLGVLEDDDNPLRVYSERSYAEVVGLAFRDMPTPNMLRAFRDAVLLREPDNKRRVQFIKGDPGAGKSHMAKLLARMSSKQGALVVDCGGKNLSELLFETVLDFNSDSRFYAELDRRLGQGQLNPLSVQILKDAMGDAFFEDGFRQAIDWAAVGDPKGDDFGVDETRGHFSREVRISNALEALKRVSHIEGMGSLGGNTLGMATQEGPLIRAFKEGRELVLDEYNKSKEGTDDVLQSVLQFLAGEIDEHTVENKLKEKGNSASQTFTFRRSDMKPGFFVTLTGNAIEDGKTTRRLSKSVNSRLDPYTLPLANVEDWQHRICQLMTGLPVSTIYRSSEAQWKDDKEGFGKMLLQLRFLGLNEKERAAVPPHQVMMLRNWDRVLEGTAKLARFYHAWSQMVDPNSRLLQSPNYADVMLEVDEEYCSEMAVDFRKIIKHLAEAQPVIGKVAAPQDAIGYELGDWSRAPQLAPSSAQQEPPEAEFGSRYVTVLMDKVTETTRDLGKTNLHRRLMALAEECGLTGTVLEEGAATQRRLVADLLNIHSGDELSPSGQARLVQGQLCRLLRSHDSRLGMSDDRIVGLPKLMAVLSALEDHPVEITPDSNRIWLPNLDARKAGAEPLVQCASQDAVGSAEEPSLQSLAEHSEVMLSLALPRVGERNLQALFTKGLSASGLTSGAGDAVVDDSLGVAELSSPTMLGLTTLMLRKDSPTGPKAVPVHVLHNASSGRTVVVGDTCDAGTVQMLKRRGISYVDRSQPRVLQRANAALQEVIRGAKPETMALLKRAFLLRNDVPEGGELKVETATLAELLAGTAAKPVLPHYLMRKPVHGSSPAP